MKKFALNTLFLLISVSSIPVLAAVEHSFAEQLNEQKTQLRPQEFNFFSDRYKQVKSQEKVIDKQPVTVKSDKTSFKMELDSQTRLLRDHKLYPVVSIQSLSTTH